MNKLSSFLLNSKTYIHTIISGFWVYRIRYTRILGYTEFGIPEWSNSDKLWSRRSGREHLFPILAKQFDNPKISKNKLIFWSIFRSRNTTKYMFCIEFLTMGFPEKLTVCVFYELNPVKVKTTVRAAFYKLNLSYCGVSQQTHGHGSVDKPMGCGFGCSTSTIKISNSWEVQASGRQLFECSCVEFKTDLELGCAAELTT